MTLAANLMASLLLWGAAALLCLMARPVREGSPLLISWFWRHTPTLGRIPLALGTAGIAALAVIWAGQGDAVGWLLLPVLTLPLLLPVASASTSIRVSGRSLALIAAGTLGLAAALTHPWAMPELRVGRWKEAVVSLALMGGDEAQPAITNTSFAYWLPSGILLGLALPAVVACFAALRRWSVAEAAERARLVAKGLAGVLAASYLVDCLTAVPASQRESRKRARMIEQEAQGYPL